MYPNIKPSDRATLAAAIDPQNAAVGVLTTGWISMATYDQIEAIIQVGTLGTSATINAKLQQATSSAGAGAKDVTGKAISQITTSSQQAIINCRSDELDVTNGFAFVELVVTVGVAASEVAALVLGNDARYQPATAAPSVAQVI